MRSKSFRRKQKTTRRKRGGQDKVSEIDWDALESGPEPRVPETNERDLDEAEIEANIKEMYPKPRERAHVEPDDIDDTLPPNVPEPPRLQRANSREIDEMEDAGDDDYTKVYDHDFYGGKRKRKSRKQKKSRKQLKSKKSRKQKSRKQKK